jgi:hypothetical protein
MIFGETARPSVVPQMRFEEVSFLVGIDLDPDLVGGFEFDSAAGLDEKDLVLHLRGPFGRWRFGVECDLGIEAIVDVGKGGTVESAAAVCTKR